MTKDLDHILKKRANVVSTMHTSQMHPSQIQNVISVMKMKTIKQQMDLKAPKLYNTLHVKNSENDTKWEVPIAEKEIAFSVCFLVPIKIKANIAMGNAKNILFANISHRKNIQSKRMYWSAMSTEVMLKINSYCRNIKIDASWGKPNYQRHFHRTWSLRSTPFSKLQIATMKSTFQMRKRPSTFFKILKWVNSSIHFLMMWVAVICSQGMMT